MNKKYRWVGEDKDFGEGPFSTNSPYEIIGTNDFSSFKDEIESGCAKNGVLVDPHEYLASVKAEREELHRMGFDPDDMPRGSRPDFLSVSRGVPLLARLDEFSDGSFALMHPASRRRLYGKQEFAWLYFHGLVRFSALHTNAPWVLVDDDKKWEEALKDSVSQKSNEEPVGDMWDELDNLSLEQAGYREDL